jgi:L-aspartate oxidase
VTAAGSAVADLIVVGSGVAALTAALEAQSCGLEVIVVTKAEASECSTRFAQGGVAVALPGDADDSVERHVADTLTAGAGLSDDLAASAILTDGPEAVTALLESGANFDTTPQGRLARTAEGGHSAQRVIHAGGDATGAEIERTLLAAARDRRLPILERHCALQVLLTEAGEVAGLLVIDADDRPTVLVAPAVLLATGGVGHLYATTTNPEVATGDGLALALRAGAVGADLEFVQFHPTALYTGPRSRGRRPLITEAVRGEGGVLIDASGARIMNGVHPLGDLAPRDVVAAAITRRMTETGTDHVYLDATHLGAVEFRQRFPTVHGICAATDIDPVSQPIPVAPAAHYHCGGVLTDVDGHTGVPGLYAVGETARTGLHGANRLASNSLLEALVVAKRAANTISAGAPGARRSRPRPVVPPTRIPSAPAAPRAGLQDLMTRYCGIGRDELGIASALARLDAMAVDQTMRTRAEVEDAGLTLVARAVLAAAAMRRESRGCHVRTDYREPSPEWQQTITVALDDAGRPRASSPAITAPAPALAVAPA